MRLMLPLLGIRPSRSKFLATSLFDTPSLCVGRGRRKRTSAWEPAAEGSSLLAPGDLRSQLGLRETPPTDDEQISLSDRINSMIV